MHARLTRCCRSLSSLRSALEIVIQIAANRRWALECVSRAVTASRPPTPCFGFSLWHHGCSRPGAQAGFAMYESTLRAAPHASQTSCFLPPPIAYGSSCSCSCSCNSTKIVQGWGGTYVGGLIRTPSRRHFESKRTSKTGSTILRRKLGLETGSSRSENFASSAHHHPMGC